MPRKLPVIDGETGFFWTSGADGKLRIQHCDACGHWQHPPLVRCHTCHSAELSPQPVSGRGRVASWTVNQQTWQGEADSSFVFAAIELEEQAELYVFSNLQCPPDAATSGAAVEVTFEQQDDVWIPLFRPIGTGNA